MNHTRIVLWMIRSIGILMLLYKMILSLLLTHNLAVILILTYLSIPKYVYLF